MNTNISRHVRVNDTLWVEIHNPPVNFITVDICEEIYLLIKEVEKDHASASSSSPVVSRTPISSTSPSRSS